MIPRGPKLQAKDAKEYLELIEQAISEVDDLRSSVAFDEGYHGEMDGYVDKLGKHLDKLKKSLNPENPELTGENLGFMEVVAVTDISFLPFKHLLLRINATNKLGFNPEGLEIKIDCYFRQGSSIFAQPRNLG